VVYPESPEGRKLLNNACTVAFIAMEKAEQAQNLSMEFCEAEAKEKEGKIT